MSLACSMGRALGIPPGFLVTALLSDYYGYGVLATT